MPRFLLFLRRRFVALAFASVAIALIPIGLAYFSKTSAPVLKKPTKRTIGDVSPRTKNLDPSLPEKLELPLKTESRLPRDESRSKPKVFVLGLDGASWKVLKPLLVGGELPNFTRLCASGSFGRLKTDVGYSPVSWTSIMTGMSSEKHGIVLTDDAHLTWSQSYRKRVFHLWDLLAGRGYKTGLVNYEYLSPQFVPPNTFFLRDDIAVPPDLIAEDQMRDAEPPGLDAGYRKANRKALYLMKSKPYDVFIYTSKEPDDTHHSDFLYYSLVNSYGLESIEATPTAVREIRQGWDAVRNIYHMLDYLLGEVLDLKPDYIFIVSDHGIHTENLLKTMRFKRELFQALNLLPPFVKAEEEPLCGVSEKGFCRIFTQTEPPGLVERQTASESFPFCSVPHADLKIDVEIRFPQIRLSYPSAPPAGFNKMQNMASNLKCENDPVVQVHSKGAQAEIAPSPEMIKRVLEGRGTCGFIESNTYGANHNVSDDGIIIMSGEGIRSGNEITGAVLYDLVPTLLYFLGEPAAKDFDGKVLTEAVEKSYLLSHPVRMIETYGRPEDTGDQKRDLTEEDIRRLKALGYISD